MLVFNSSLEQSIYFIYFLIHIPITIFIDSSVVVPKRYNISGNLVDWYIANNGDFLLAERPLWLQLFVGIELVFQLPLFFYFVYKLKDTNSKVPTKKSEKSNQQRDKNRTRMWLKLYGWNAALTTLICIAAIIVRQSDSLDASPLLNSNKFKLVMIYMPILIISGRLCLF